MICKLFVTFRMTISLLCCCNITFKEKLASMWGPDEEGFLSKTSKSLSIRTRNTHNNGWVHKRYLQTNQKKWAYLKYSCILLHIVWLFNLISDQLYLKIWFKQKQQRVWIISKTSNQTSFWLLDRNNSLNEMIDEKKLFSKCS